MLVFLDVLLSKQMMLKQLTVKSNNATTLSLTILLFQL
jgi:hypothetical protein